MEGKINSEKDDIQMFLLTTFGETKLLFKIKIMNSTNMSELSFFGLFEINKICFMFFKRFRFC